MYKAGDKVIHQKEGACYIKGTTNIKQDGTDREYYVLSPITNDGISIYAPVKQSGRLRIRPVVSYTVLKDTEETVKNITPEWIDDEKQRVKISAETLRSFEFLENIILVKSLLIRNKVKNLGSRDQQTLAAAQKLVYSEIAILLNQEYSFVSDKIEQFCFATA